jgi:hypothetical protein
MWLCVCVWVFLKTNRKKERKKEENKNRIVMSATQQKTQQTQLTQQLTLAASKHVARATISQMYEGRSNTYREHICITNIFEFKSTCGVWSFHLNRLRCSPKRWCTNSPTIMNVLCSFRCYVRGIFDHSLFTETKLDGQPLYQLSPFSSGGLFSALISTVIHQLVQMFACEIFLCEPSLTLLMLD